MTKAKREKSIAIHWISSNCRENFSDFCMEVLNKTIAQLNTCQVNFCSSLKIHENCKTFLLLNFYRLHYDMYSDWIKYCIAGKTFEAQFL